MRTSRWHCLEHNVSSLKGAGGIEYLLTSDYERGHKIFERAYKRTSKQNGSAIKESLSVLELQSSLEVKLASAEAECTSDISRVGLVHEKNFCLINSYKHVLFVDFQNVLN